MKYKKAKPKIPYAVARRLGQKFNNLTVLEYVTYVEYIQRPTEVIPNAVKRKYYIVLAQCECGEKKEIFLHNIVYGHSQTCNCSHGTYAHKRIGEKYGMLTIEKILKTTKSNMKATKKYPNGRVFTRHIVRCLCDCGKTKKAYINNVISGKVNNCGCQEHFNRGKNLVGRTWKKIDGKRVYSPRLIP